MFLSIICFLLHFCRTMFLSIICFLLHFCRTMFLSIICFLLHFCGLVSTVLYLLLGALSRLVLTDHGNLVAE